MRRNSTIFILLLVTFIVGTLIGWGIAKVNPELAKNTYMILRRILGGGELPQGFKLFMLIFLNNTRVAVLVAFGALLFGIIPFLVLLLNGMIVGLVVGHVMISEEVPFSKVLLSILPHGVVEIPAFAVAGVGGINWFLELIHGEGNFGERFRRGFRKMLKFLILSVVLLFIAALIEAFITPRLIGLA
ncbi:stage II sporulation protein M [Pyrococcus abyssi]|uniref:Stage II sporulation protein m related n=1 Tax=Pyrococcus abyssi (strain GE5 / Orsay) TaxID=272844 RepID=Q9V182_PYRAB|nr:stage II sporulation protein M [Pyrococcus abyssi]CAB49468.1 spoIIM-like stage II sporulation protein M related [Pyrococcus abyssi GE5]CCE69935.1 TPA: stage II sporulation protein m related [Pyrococcus abyssi GE5]